MAETATAAPILSARGLVSGYGRIETLHGVDINVPETGVTSIIGPNGSGKSTLLKSVVGLLKPWEGEVMLRSLDITGMAAHKLVRHGVTMVPQGRVVFPYLSVEDNLRTCAYTVRSREEVDGRLAEAYEFMPILGERRLQLASSLSGGEQVMLSLGKVLMQKPELLLVDEPSLGLAPKIIEFVYNRIRDLTDRGVTTLLVEQNVRKALSIADHVVVLVLGEVRYEGSPDDLESTIDLGTLFLEGKMS